MSDVLIGDFTEEVFVPDAGEGSWTMRQHKRDLVFTEGRLSLVKGPEARAQRVAIALRHFKGEWYLDQNDGTDYFAKILGKATDLSRRAEVRRRILSVPGIVEIQSLTLTLDPVTRAMRGHAEVLDITGVTTPLDLTELT